MRHFFSGRKFKVLLGVLVLLAGFMTYAGVSGNLSGFPGQVANAIMVPFQRISSAISNGVEGMVNRYLRFNDVLEQNEELLERVEELEGQLIEYDDAIAENEQLREFYSLQEENPEWEMVSGTVIGRDPLAQFYSFTIDRGAAHGIDIGQPVVAGEGTLVGIVADVGPNYAVVKTILDPSVSAAAMVSGTRDSGVVGGDANYAAQGQCTMVHLARDTGAQPGDLVVTTGLGEVFPKGLKVGTVQEVLADPSGTSMYAVVQPGKDIASIHSVMVITSFS